MSLVPKIGFFFKLLRGHLGCGSGAVPIRSSPEASSDTGRGTGKEHATADLTGFSDLRKPPSNRPGRGHKTQCRKTNRMILDYNDSFRPEIESRVENRWIEPRPPGSWRPRCPWPFVPPCHQRGGRRRPEQAVSATGRGPRMRPSYGGESTFLRFVFLYSALLKASSGKERTG